MKKLVVMSDTHGRRDEIMRVIKKHPDADALIHLGDQNSDMTHPARFFCGEIYMVSGNCDVIKDYPAERMVNLDGYQLLLCHGHKYNVKFGMLQIAYAASEKNADIVLFGHTHTRCNRYNNGIFFFNPGALLSGSYGILVIDGGIKAYFDNINSI